MATGKSPSKLEKEQMQEFLVGILEYQGYKIAQAGIDTIDFLKGNQGHHLLLHNKPRTEANIIAWNQTHIVQEDKVGHIFYKSTNPNINLGWVRLAKRVIRKAYKSLKRYTHEEQNRMLHLRKSEKIQVVTFGPYLNYYQPESANLDERLLLVKVRPVHLDYSHITEGDPKYGFAINHDSKDYFLPQISQEILGAAEVALWKKSRNYFVLKQGAYQPNLFD